MKNAVNSENKEDLKLIKRREMFYTRIDILSEALGSSTNIVFFGGTSLVVYPAAGLVDYFRGSKLILINKSSTPYDSKADIVVHDAIGKVLSQAVKML